MVSTNIAATSLTIEGVRYRFLPFLKTVTEGKIQKVLLDLGGTSDPSATVLPSDYPLPLFVYVVNEKALSILFYSLMGD